MLCHRSLYPVWRDIFCGILPTRCLSPVQRPSAFSLILQACVLPPFPPLPSPHPRLFFALPPSPRWVSPNKVDCSQRTTGSVTASLTAKLLPAGSEGGRRRLLVCGLACPMACPISARTALIDHAACPHVPRPVGDTEPCLCWADS